MLIVVFDDIYRYLWSYSSIYAGNAYVLTRVRTRQPAPFTGAARENCLWRENYSPVFYVHVTVHRNKFLYNKAN